MIVALLGLAVRLPQLGQRPMHTDEAVNGYIVGELLAGKSYPYNAGDRHGPALTELALPLARFQGAKAFGDLTETQLRLTSVIAGTLTLLLFGLAAKMFGLLPSLLAALILATAALPVYYDRYFIHESLFVCATFGLLLSGWQAVERRSLGQAALAGGCAGLMLACKETAVLHFAAIAWAALCVRSWARPGRAALDGKWLRLAAVGVVVFVVVAVLLFTGFGREWKALATLAHAGPAYLARARGAGHQKAFSYYVLLLGSTWSGAAVCALACFGLVRTIRLHLVKRREPSPSGFLAFYFVLLAAIYSLIPYKTPWLAQNFWVPLSLFAGLGMTALWRALARFRTAPVAAVAAVALLAVLLARDTRRLVFLHPADEDNPYAYAHTSEDLLGLVPAIDRVALESGVPVPRIAVIAADPWPLPWYLRRYPQTGYWQRADQAADADLYITSTDAAEEASDRLQGFRADFFGLRPGVLILLWSRGRQ